MPRIQGAIAKVARKPGPPTLFHQSFSQDLETAIDPSVTITRYNRTWRFSRPRRMQGFLVGKLGFTSEASAIQVSYDEANQDFVEHPSDTSQGDFVHWAVNLEDQMMAFEIRPPTIKVQTFIGAFKELLDAHSEFSFTVELVLEPAQFYEWVRDIDRLVSFRAAMRAPNPDWGSRPRRLIELIQETNASRATVEVKAGDGTDEGLKVNGTVLQDMVEYGGQGYSTIRAEGVKNGRRRLFHSERRVPVDSAEVEQGASEEIIWAYLFSVHAMLAPK